MWDELNGLIVDCSSKHLENDPRTNSFGTENGTSSLKSTQYNKWVVINYNYSRAQTSTTCKSCKQKESIKKFNLLSIKKNLLLLEIISSFNFLLVS